MGYDAHHHEQHDDGEETAEQRREKSEADVLHAARLVGWFLAETLTALNRETMKRIAMQLERFGWFELPHLLIAPLPVARLQRAWDDYCDRDEEACKVTLEAEHEAQAEFDSFLPPTRGSV